MTRLNQYIAIEQGVKSDAAKRTAELMAALSTAPLLNGLARTYQPNDVEHGYQYAGERTKVQLTVEEAIGQLMLTLTRLFDVTLTKDSANTAASADIVVNDPATGVSRTLAQAVPVTYLLFLEKELAKLRVFINALPVQDPAEEWTTEGAPPGQWKTEAVVTDKTKQVPRNHIKWEPPSPEYAQPAQVETYMENVPEGRWSVVKFTGAIPARQVRVYLDRVTELQRAVKFAREEANSAQITDEHAGDILRFVFA